MKGEGEGNEDRFLPYESEVYNWIISDMLFRWNRDCVTNYYSSKENKNEKNKDKTTKDSILFWSKRSLPLPLPLLSLMRMVMIFFVSFSPQYAPALCLSRSICLSDANHFFLLLSACFHHPDLVYSHWSLCSAIMPVPCIDASCLYYSFSSNMPFESI